MDQHQQSSKEVLRKEEFKQSTLGIHISKNGITFCLHPAHQDVSVSYIQAENGRFSKEELFQKIKDFDAMLYSFVPNISIVATTISFPGPIDNGVVEITNWWSTGDNHFSRNEFTNFKCCSAKEFSMINEIQALGHGIISTDEFYGLEDDFAPLWKPPAMDIMPTLYPLYFSSEAAAVLRISGGLGAAFIVPIDSSDSYRVIASEWGHSMLQICGPEEAQYEEELALMNYIREKKGAAVEWEDICSSRGLRTCYDFELAKQASTNSQQSNNAQGQSSTNASNLANSNQSEFDQIKEIEKDPNDPIASKALETHFKFIMRFARTCAIGFKCKSVFITYSVFNDGPKCFQKHIAMCRDEFMHFTKSEWVSNVSVFVQSSNRNISAMGVMYHAFLELARSENQETISVNGIDHTEIEPH